MVRIGDNPSFRVNPTKKTKCILTSPQELVGMIVEKAVNMADLMDIPILGLVENMSYMLCPDCKKELYPFGKGNIQQIAVKHNIKFTARVPLCPELAAACDAGRIEEFQGDWLEEMSAILR